MVIDMSTSGRVQGLGTVARHQMDVATGGGRTVALRRIQQWLDTVCTTVPGTDDRAGSGREPIECAETGDLSCL